MQDTSLGLDYDQFSARPVTIEDAADMLAWRNRDEVREGMFHSRLITMQEQLPWLEGRIRSPSSEYFIFEHAGRPTGVFGVYDIDRGSGSGEWVYFMGPRYPGLPKGAGAAMEFFALETFFFKIGLRRLWGRTLLTNERVWRMHERFGFRLEGELRAHIVKDGEPQDLKIVGMLVDEWRIRRRTQFSSLFSGDCPPEPS